MTAPHPDVSIVVRTRNRAELLERCITSLASQELPGRSVEIVVIDNASTDDTRQVVERLAAASQTPVRYVLESETGLSPPLNRGVREARAGILAFCDDDQTAAPDWLAVYLAAKERTRSRYLGGSILLDLPHPVDLGPICRQLLGEHAWEGDSRPVHGKEVPSIGNLLIDRDVFETVGLFATDAHSGGEDTDFTTRVRRAGIEIHIVPRAVVYHHIPPHRLLPGYFHWVSLRWGHILARRDLMLGGRRRLVLQGAGRAVQLVAVLLPRLFIRRVRGDKAALLDMKCLVWRAWSYLRSSLHFAAPHLFAQKRFLAQLDFSAEKALREAAEGGR